MVKKLIWNGTDYFELIKNDKIINNLKNHYSSKIKHIRYY